MSQVILKPIAKPPNKGASKKESNENVSSYALLSPIEFAPNSPFVPLTKIPPTIAEPTKEEVNRSSTLSSIPKGAQLLYYSPGPAPSPLSAVSPTSLMAMIQRMHRPPPVPKSNQYKSVKEYVDLVRAEDDGYIHHLQSIAKQIFAERGPLCDSEGFYQHSGECWNDSFQQILFNADMIKEQIQSQILTIDFSLDTFGLPDFLFVPMNKLDTAKEYVIEFKDEIQVQKEWTFLYLAEMQKRFLRHYIAEGLRRKEKVESCATGELAEIARQRIKEIGKSTEQRRKGLEAKRGAIFGRLLPLNDYAFRPTVEEYTAKKELTGGTDFDIQILFNVVNYVFFSGIPLKLNIQVPFTLKNSFVDIATFKKFLDRVNSCLLVCSNKATNVVDSHEMAFYQCGSNSYLFDNNSGSILFDWRTFLIYYFNLILEELTPVIVFTQVNFYDESTYLNYFFYPVIQHQNKTGTGYSTIILAKEEIVDITDQMTDVQNPNFKFKVELETVKLYGEIDRTKNHIFENISFIYNEKITEITNVGYEMNQVRLKRNPLEIYLLNKNTEAALQFIDEAPVVPNLTGILASGDVPILYIAIELGLEDAALKLVEKGYNYKYTVKGMTALMQSVVKNQYRLFKELLKLGVNLSNINNAELQAIHFAAKQGVPIEFLKDLIDAGANIEAKTAGGATPLMIAAVNEELEKVKYLCSKGADAGAKSILDKTALDIAINEEIKAALTSCKKEGGRRKGKGKKTMRKRKGKAKKRRYTRVK